MEEIYNKWQLTELELRNIEPVRFTKEELLDFANYYYEKQLNIGSVIGSSEITISKKEYEKLKRDSENLGMVSFTM